MTKWTDQEFECPKS